MDDEAWKKWFAIVRDEERQRSEGLELVEREMTRRRLKSVKKEMTFKVVKSEEREVRIKGSKAAKREPRVKKEKSLPMCCAVWRRNLQRKSGCRRGSCGVYESFKRRKSPPLSSSTQRSTMSTLPINTCMVCYRKVGKSELEEVDWRRRMRVSAGQRHSQFNCQRCFPVGEKVLGCGDCVEGLERGVLSPAASLHSRIGCEHMFPDELKGLTPIEEKLIALNTYYGSSRNTLFQEVKDRARDTRSMSRGTLQCFRIMSRSS